FPRELNQPVVHERETLSKKIRREARRLDDLPARELDSSNGRLSVQTGALIEASVLPDQTLSVSVRIVRVRGDDVELRLSGKPVVSRLLLVGGLGGLRSGFFSQGIHREHACDYEHERRGKTHQTPRVGARGVFRGDRSRGSLSRRFFLQSKTPRRFISRPLYDRARQNNE